MHVGASASQLLRRAFQRGFGDFVANIVRQRVFGTDRSAACEQSGCEPEQRARARQHLDPRCQGAGARGGEDVGGRRGQARPIGRKDVAGQRAGIVPDQAFGLNQPGVQEGVPVPRLNS